MLMGAIAMVLHSDIVCLLVEEGKNKGREGKRRGVNRRGGAQHARVK